ncbi:hypothetical protein RhiirC2_774837 [Rhizophagus irregularis]|uniref:Uncharacterized protein n=1 Tax=Rhizophagus irregularis TaxID=588596 RepID=A0A2N1NKE7_9GLOM|nr:hypothetical protein RhiirC2_774837 [Rhizophagus irregularis]
MEGLYPQPSVLAFSQEKNKYKIPDCYCVKTTWGRGNNKHTVKCSINYVRDKLHFRIMYGLDFSEEVYSNMSSTAAANAVVRKLFPNNEKTLISGIHLFGIHLKTLKQKPLKPLDLCRVKIYGEDQVTLKRILYNVNHTDFQINYGLKDNEEKEKKLTSIVQIIDQNYIPREGYQALIAIEPDLEHFDESSNILNSEITEINNISNGGHRSAKDILKYIISALALNGVLDVNDLIIHLRISEDGRNVGRRLKQVIITMTILNDIQNIHKPDHHYTTVLFPGIENYELLEIMMMPFIQELDDLKNYGLKIDEIVWKFKLYFSSDWKFLSICLGFNAANSNFFCPWYQISKHGQNNNQTNWKISKEIEKINEYPGHNKRPLFYMISLNNWVPDELYIMLRIWDCLWSLVISELKESNQFDDEHGADAWNHTLLMGDDKLKVLKNFNLGRILPPTRAKKIRELWNKFNQIYFNLKTKDYNVQQFQFEVKDWLELFLTPDRIISNSNRIEKGLYSPSSITPYIHVLVCHISEFMEIHQKWGMKAFSCGGSKHKLVIRDILEYENKSLFYLFNDNTISSKPKKLHIED